MGRRLIRHRVRSALRRATALASPSQFLGLALAGLATYGVGLLCHDLALADLGDSASAALIHKVIGDRIFWFNALAALIFAYTSFEVIFRARDNSFISLLPLDGALRWYDLAARSLVLHMPLLIPALGYASGLLIGGDHVSALRTLTVCGLTMVLGLIGCARLHLMAGRTVLREATPMQQYLASTVVDAEAALLLYAPAGGFAATLIGALLFDTFARKLIETDQGLFPLMLVGLALLVWGVSLLRAGGAEARRCLPLVISRFHEVDTPLPYRDDGYPERTAGESAAGWLSRLASAFFMRDLKQLSRRHRVDQVLFWAFSLMMLPIAFEARGETEELLSAIRDALTTYLAFVTLGWVSAFRVRGPELYCDYLSLTLPIESPRHAILGQLMAEARRPALAALILGAAVGTSALTGGGFIAGVSWCAGAGFTAFITALLALALANALAALGRGSVFYAATAWRAAMILLLFVVDIFHLTT